MVLQIVNLKWEANNEQKRNIKEKLLISVLTLEMLNRNTYKNYTIKETFKA